MPDSDKPTCGRWMPNAKAHCGRRPGHPGKCVSPEAYVGLLHVRCNTIVGYVEKYGELAKAYLATFGKAKVQA